MEYISAEDYTSLLKSNPDKALEYLYDQYYDTMCAMVYRLLKDSSLAEDIVQEVFFAVWRKKDELNFTTSVEAYLKRSCRNRTLNYIRNNFYWDDESELIDQVDREFTSDHYIDAEELQKKINNAISTLPEKCNLVFSMSRFEEMSYADISKELDISIKTVEHHISKALRILRANILKKE